MYMEHNWDICIDLKKVKLLLGQQSGFTKHHCYICLWNSRAKATRWTKKYLPVEIELVLGWLHVIVGTLVSRDR